MNSCVIDKKLMPSDIIWPFDYRFTYLSHQMTIGSFGILWYSVQFTKFVICNKVKRKLKTVELNLATMLDPV